jgi:hypothetical protein
MTAEEFKHQFGLTLPSVYLEKASQSDEIAGYDYVPGPRYKEFNAEYESGEQASVHNATLLFLTSSVAGMLMPSSLEMLRYYRDLPDQFFPIAAIGNGDYVLCDTEAQNSNRGTGIFYWDHESGDMFPIAESLESFYGSLKKVNWDE